MNPAINTAALETRPRVRTGVLILCAILLGIALLPTVISGRHSLQFLLLWVAVAAQLLGWILLVKNREFTLTPRGWIAAIASACVTISIPAFFFELHGLEWFMRHEWVSPYLEPWVHWGFLLIPLGALGSSLGRGRSRLAFLAGSVLLLILWQSAKAWIF
jgi:hypothetical protein